MSDSAREGPGTDLPSVPGPSVVPVPAVAGQDRGEHGKDDEGVLVADRTVGQGGGNWLRIARHTPDAPDEDGRAAVDAAVAAVTGAPGRG